MAGIETSDERFLSFHHMYSQESRERSFADWPFREDCMCTPEKMSRAGFVHCPSENKPDIACCFYCLLELEDWEPDDDPRMEHVKRSPNCRYLMMDKDFTELTVAEFYHMEKDRLKIYIRKTCQAKIDCFRKEMDRTLNDLKSMRDANF